MTVHDDLARAHRALILSELSRPEAYPFPVERIDVEETHISLVFLAGEYVYKVKKPVNFGFLDFSTLEQRRFFCEQEVLLNQRLTDGVYLGVVPIARIGSHLRVEAPGEVVEYAVKMRRLDFEQTLLRRLQRDAVSMELLAALADRLAEFYRAAARSPEIDRWGTPEAVWFNIRENLDQTEPYIGVVLAPLQHRWIASISERFLRERLDLFQRRIAEGRIVEGHGDLHLAHIFVESDSPPRFQIVDRIEFNPRLLCGDVAVDLAFLSQHFLYHVVIAAGDAGRGYYQVGVHGPLDLGPQGGNVVPGDAQHTWDAPVLSHQGCHPISVAVVYLVGALGAPRAHHFIAGGDDSYHRPPDDTGPVPPQRC